ncbi:methionyl-tRNA formyltransferase [Acholeplasma equirhinis]|uniref:methionyl-tRNA formyltransferase n=1 Tax=Acholeplasma equirhinis TaxID=555393 RepID=UPI00197AFD55|nr:methionyl-tRNA formyltransferase [Acholeplasma equirhinis]MBN3490689.1 methionyl-tRNA formyltransferase [Acholeplasma equirhinis]
MIVFMGTPEFSVPILEMLIKENYPVGLVVTQPDRVVGRKKELQKSPVKQLAESYGIEVFQPEKLRLDYQYVIDKKPSLIVTASYGQILPKALLDTIPAVNIHGSLLPKYRGGAPIQYALFNGDKETGITLMEMAFKMDSGAMIEKRTIEILDSDDYGTLSQKLSYIGRDLLKENIDKVLAKNYTAIPQNEDEVTFAFTLKYEDEALDFNKTVFWNHNRIRGLSPNVGAHFVYRNVLVKVFKSHKSDIMDLNPGEIRIIGKRLVIGCLDGGIELDLIQQAGKKLMPVRDYLNGQTLFENGGIING